MRQSLKDQEIGLDPNFRYRGKNQTRIETLSDAVFALGITLLVLSSTVPTSLSELINSMRNVLPFGACVVLIMVIWYQHYIYFIRFGLQSVKIVTINTILLFLILVYVYPLKFLTRLLFELYLGLITSDWAYFSATYQEEFTLTNMSVLLIIYGAGAALIFLTLAWMYAYALKKRSSLRLSEYEVFKSNESLRINLLMASIPFLSAILAAFFGRTQTGMAVSGFIYMLYPIVLPLYGFLSGRRQKKILEKITAE